MSKPKIGGVIMKLWIGSVVAAGILLSATVGWADTILFRPGGVLNGLAVDSPGTTVAVDPGAQISGTLEIRVNNSHGSGPIVPVGGTVTWGDRETQAWEIYNHVRTGWTDLSVNIEEIAPTTPGLYYIVFANAGECRSSQVMSATSWAVQGSPAYCGSLESDPIWHDGNDIGWDWSDEHFQQAKDTGQVTQMWWWPRDNEFREITIGANWVGIEVLDTGDDTGDDGGDDTGDVGGGGGGGCFISDLF